NPVDIGSTASAWTLTVILSKAIAVAAKRLNRPIELRISIS
ncbi:MAG: hypothetical protein ACI8PP_002747, partial [Candidatus Pseudothioglobus sp.]